MKNNLYKYPHPYVAVDGVLLRVRNGQIEVKLIPQPEMDGVWCLPGGFMSIEKRAMDTLREKMWEKAGVKDFYAEQLQTYDSLERDERGRVVSIAYLCLTNDQAADPSWFVYADGKLTLGKTVIPLEDLAFDHGQIISDAVKRLSNKLWYSDLAKYLLPETFKLAEIQALYELLEDSRYFTNFRRNIGSRIIETGLVETAPTPGRRAKFYRWNDENELKGA